MKLYIVFFSLGFLLSCSNYKETPVKNKYVQEWEQFNTKLIKTEKSFQEFEEFEYKRNNIQLVKYQSDTLELKGLLNTQNIDSLIKNPVIVYFHGGFALSYRAMEATKPFTDAGFIVFAPSYRGENGNPGYFELFMGEVRDAKAALKWISNQEFVDDENIYIFGWSVGGGISLNLSLHNDIPVKLGGSSAGIYDYDLIKSWATEDDMIVFPYDYTNQVENYFRLPLYNLQNMVRPHVTYIAVEDYYDYDFIKNLKDSLYLENDIEMRLIKLEGNHVSSLPKAMDSFLVEIKNQMAITKDKMH